LSERQPYLSIIVGARNDNYGGDFTRRLQTFVSVLCGWAARHALDGELVIVEWNPPAERPRLREELAWPAARGALAIRIIEVPRAAHLRLQNAERMPMFEYFAKNAGIRRARGEFILVTNPDLVYSGELVAWLATRPLQPGAYYRMDRFDFSGPALAASDPAAVVRHAQKRVFAAHYRQAGGGGRTRRVGPLRRRIGSLAGLWPCSGGLRHRLAGGLVLPIADNGQANGVHTNAAGDFILAHRSQWETIRGFPEFGDTFTGLDGYACYQLHALGLQQTVVLPPAMILHADHSRTEQGTRPRASVEEYRANVERIRSGALGPALNGPQWGLGGEALAETAA
jgi:hypothetical protein